MANSLHLTYASEQGRDDIITLYDSAPGVNSVLLLAILYGSKWSQTTEIQGEGEWTLLSDGNVASLLCKRENV